MKKLIQCLITMLIFVGMVFPFTSCRKSIQKDIKTYSNEFFSFKYPKEWFLSDESNQISINGPEELGYYVNVKFDYNAKIGLNLNDFKNTVESQNNLDTLPQFKDMGEINLNIGNQPAIQHNILTTIQAQKSLLTLFVRLTYLVKDDNFGIVITAEVPQDVLGKYESQINEIIQSFRFK